MNCVLANTMLSFCVHVTHLILFKGFPHNVVVVCKILTALNNNMSHRVWALSLNTEDYQKISTIVLLDDTGEQATETAEEEFFSGPREGAPCGASMWEERGCRKLSGLRRLQEIPLGDAFVVGSISAMRSSTGNNCVGEFYRPVLVLRRNCRI